MSKEELLAKYRRILDAIHEGGNIFYDKGRMEAYSMIAKISSDLRRAPEKCSYCEKELSVCGCSYRRGGRVLP